MKLNFYLFNDFETLDLFGPVEILCRIDELEPHYYSIEGGIIKSAQKTEIVTEPISACDPNGIFVIPGGAGTRPLVKNTRELEIIKKYAGQSSWCLSICTGSAVLACCGLLDGREATSNKKAFDWVSGFGNGVKWNREARFCKDGKFYTSAGVSAGIDMAVKFTADNYGKELAKKIIEDIEYSQENLR